MKSLKAKLVGVIVVSLVLLMILLSFIGISQMRSGMQQEVLSALEYTANGVRAGYDILGGTYEYKNNALYKGDKNLTEDNALIDSFRTGNVDVTIFYNDTRVVTSLKDTSGNRIIGTKLEGDFVSDVIGGSPYSTTDLTINNQSYYAYYMPYETGMIFAGVPAKSVNEHINHSILIILVVGMGVLIVAGGIGTLIIMRIANIIKDATSVLTNMSNGCIDVDCSSYINRNDELGAMGRALDSLGTQLTSVVKDVNKNEGDVSENVRVLGGVVETVDTIVGNVNQAVQNIAEGAVSQAEEVTEANTEVQNLGESIHAVDTEVDSLRGTLNNVVSIGESSVESINALVLQNNEVIETISVIADNVNDTNVSVRDIEEAITLISDIASQTNLLSLNASIEAARAGESGKGFSVVATEIQKLAEASNQAASKVKDIISSLRVGSDNSINSINTVQEQIGTQKKSLEGVVESVRSVNNDIKGLSTNMNTLDELMRKCDGVRKTVSEAMMNLSAISEENAASAEETSVSITDFKGQIQELNSVSDNMNVVSEALHSSMSFFK